MFKKVLKFIFCGFPKTHPVGVVLCIEFVLAYKVIEEFTFPWEAHEYKNQS